MTFRLPYQILRAVSRSRPSSPNKLFTPTQIPNEFQTSNLSSLVDSNNNRKILQSSYAYGVRQNGPTLPHYLPRYTCQHRFKSTSYEQRKNLENRKKVRRLHKCFERKCERKLAFRQTTREECEQCIGTPVPDKCPKLRRIKPAYDESKLKWKHENCPVDICLETPRMDVVKGLKVERKKLPKLIATDCERCLPYVPTKAPKLVRPKKQYDPYKLEQDRNCYKDLCNIDPPRMDDVRGYTVKSKKLPKIPAECVQCAAHVPKKAPKLVRPKQRYDPYKMEQDRNCYKDLCNIDPPRMDDVVGLKVVNKKLPKLRIDECGPCLNEKPTKAPKLVRPKRKYDPSKMKWQHPPCKDFCDDAAPRMDDVRGVKVVKKTLPKLKANKCERCIVVPTKAPKLVRPQKRYDDTKLKWEHSFCPKDTCEEHPERMDKILGLKVEKKKLPKLTCSKECTYCRDVPTTAPKLVRLKKSYDDSKMKWQHDCPLVGCDAHPPRSDDVRGYKVVSKKLKKLSPPDGCRVCVDSLCMPTKAPKLTRPKQCYDPFKLEQDRNCPKDLCNIDPPRMDDVVGLKVVCKQLPKLPVGDCGPCLNEKPTKAPKLIRPKRKYDPNEMKWIHPPCKDFCDDAAPRMDDVVGYKVTPRKLPEIPAPCQQCVNFVPKYAPVLKGPKRKYDPSKLEKNHCKIVDLCDLCPPRMDDVRCWKPKKKKLPSFISSPQCRCFSTLTAAGNRMTYPVYSSKNYKKLRQKAIIYGRRYGKKPELSHTPQFPKVCPKFKCPGCKPTSGRICGATYDRTCKKTEAPYGAYSDCMDGWWEDEPTECIDWNQVMLQPQKQVQGHFYKLKPPPPKWGHVDPSLERKCKANKKPDPPPLDETDRWENPCPSFKSCGNRARKHCHVPKHHPPCKKLEAPYKSFGDQCPQFPEIILTECDLADKIFKDMMVNYKGDPMTKPPCKKYCDKKEATKGCKPQAFDACKSLPDFMKKREPVKCKIPCKKSKTSCSKNDTKKYTCKPVDTPKTKCSGPDKKIKTMVCSSKNSQKHICACKPVAKKGDSKKPTSKPSKTSCSGKGGGSKIIVCTSKDNKMVCVCKPISKCKSKGKIAPSKCGSKGKMVPSKCESKGKMAPSKCESKGKMAPPKCKSKGKMTPPKKVSCCPKKPSKSKCKTSSNASCCGRISEVKLQPVCKPASSSKTSVCCPPPSSVPPAPPSSLWDKICAYFRARPGCPGPNDWKQRELEDKARKAAEAAGLQICKPKCTYIKFEKKKLKSSCPKPKKVCCPKPKKTVVCCPKPKKSPCCTKPKKDPPCCPKKKPKKKPCCAPKKPKKKPCDRSPYKKCKQPSTSKIEGPAKKPKKMAQGKKLPNVNCPPAGSPAALKIAGPASKPNKGMPSNKPVSKLKKQRPTKLPSPLCKSQKKNYATYVAKSRYFSTYSRVNKQIKKKRSKQILANRSIIDTDSNSLSYSKRSTMNNISHSYLRLNNNYVGKIYKLKLTKIGVRNALIPRKPDDEPFTICHLCKVIPRHETTCKDNKPDIKNLKVKMKSEQRKAYN